MKRVEQCVEQPEVRWADKITVEREGDDLSVYGQNFATEPWDGPESEITEAFVGPRSPDILLAYSRFVQSLKPKKGQPRDGSLSPHIQFANASSDEKLIEFVQEWGPVNGLRPVWRPLPRGRLAALTVTENLKRLRRERLLFAGGLSLAKALTEPNSTGVARALCEVIRACMQPGAGWEQGQEIRWHGQAYLQRISHLAGEDKWPAGMPLDSFVCRLTPSAVREYGWHILCLMLSGFPPVLIGGKDGVGEIPARKMAGILPALYFMLRMDCLNKHKLGICPQRDCGRWFKVERRGQRFCTGRCARLQRQREYWPIKGKKARAVRVARKRKEKGGKKRVTV